jgi:phage-related tail protein
VDVIAAVAVIEAVGVTAAVAVTEAVGASVGVGKGVGGIVGGLGATAWTTVASAPGFQKKSALIAARAAVSTIAVQIRTWVSRSGLAAL